MSKNVDTICVQGGYQPETANPAHPNHQADNFKSQVKREHE